MNMDEAKELTFYMGDKGESELWDIVREACRVSTPAWRAYEQLHGMHTEIRKIAGQLHVIYSDGSKTT